MRPTSVSASVKSAAGTAVCVMGAAGPVGVAEARSGEVAAAAAGAAAAGGCAGGAAEVDCLPPVELQAASRPTQPSSSKRDRNSRFANRSCVIIFFLGRVK